MRVGWLCSLSKHSVGTYQETRSGATHQGRLSQWSRFTEPLWTDCGVKSNIKTISVHELISTLMKKKKATSREWMVQASPQKSSQVRKKPPLYTSFPAKRYHSTSWCPVQYSQHSYSQLTGTTKIRLRLFTETQAKWLCSGSQYLKCEWLQYSPVMECQCLKVENNCRMFWTSRNHSKEITNK